MQATAPPVRPLSGWINSFLDFCRVEKGLSANSIASYRIDLQRFDGSISKHCQDLRAEDLSGYVQSLYRAGLSPRSIARHITTLRNFFRFLIEEKHIERDPTEFLTPPKQWATLPKYLNQEEIERLLGAPPEDKPVGLRDRAMLEVLYASGLRVTELCRLEMASVERDLGLLRVMGKGNKQRVVPFGDSAGAAIERYLGAGRPMILKGRASRFLFVTARGSAMTRQSSGNYWGAMAAGWESSAP